MALVESGLREHGWRRCMQSLREQLRPEDDRDSFHYLNGRLEQLQAALKMAEERRKQPPATQVATNVATSEPEPDATPERYAQEIAAVRPQPDLGYDGLKLRKQPAESVNTPSRKHRFRDVAHRLTGKSRRTP